MEYRGGRLTSGRLAAPSGGRLSSLRLVVPEQFTLGHLALEERQSAGHTGTDNRFIKAA